MFFFRCFFNKVPLYGIALDSKQFRENGMKFWDKRVNYQFLMIVEKCLKITYKSIEVYRFND